MTDAQASARDEAGPRVVVVMPAYNAAKTLERTYADVPQDVVDRIILVDDVHRKPAIRRLQGARGVVRRHDDDDACSVFHD